jgi:hypothetical protein
MDEHDRSLIQAYAEALAESVPARATLEDVDGKTVAELKKMLAERLLKTAGSKAALVDRLLTSEPNKNAFANLYFRNAHLMVLRLIQSYGPTGYGNKPEGMSPFEYWLAHVDPEDVLRR